jgi:hypothetical protein
MRESYYLLTGMWQHYLHIVGFWYDNVERMENKKKHVKWKRTCTRECIEKNV